MSLPTDPTQNGAGASVPSGDQSPYAGGPSAPSGAAGYDGTGYGAAYGAAPESGAQPYQPYQSAPSAPGAVQSYSQPYGQQYDQAGYQQQAQYGQAYQQPGAYQQAAYGAPYSQSAYGPEQKSKLAAGLLGILLGSLGIHNFYLGRTGRGVAQLLISILSLGILALVSEIWGVVEGILILSAQPGSQPWGVDARGIPLRD